MRTRIALLSLLTYLVIHAQGQIAGPPVFVSGDLSFEKNSFHLLSPRIGVFVSPKDALGAVYSYNSDKRLRSSSNLSLFYRRHVTLSETVFLFIETSAGAGKGRSRALKGLGAHDIQTGEAALRVGFFMYLTPTLSSEFTPFAFLYRLEKREGQGSVTSNSLSGMVSLGNHIGLNIHIGKKSGTTTDKPENLSDRKLLSGEMSIVQNSGLNIRQFSFSPYIGIFITNWIEAGMAMSVLSSTQSAFDVTSAYQEQYSTMAFHLGPRIRLYHWLNPYTGLFAQARLEGTFAFSQTNRRHAQYTSSQIGPCGGLYIGFSHFLTKRTLIEATTNIYLIERHSFSPMLSQMKISLGFLLGRAAGE